MVHYVGAVTSVLGDSAPFGAPYFESHWEKGFLSKPVIQSFHKDDSASTGRRPRCIPSDAATRGEILLAGGSVEAPLDLTTLSQDLQALQEDLLFDKSDPSKVVFRSKADRMATAAASSAASVFALVDPCDLEARHEFSSDARAICALACPALSLSAHPAKTPEVIKRHFSSFEPSTMLSSDEVLPLVGSFAKGVYSLEAQRSLPFPSLLDYGKHESSFWLLNSAPGFDVYCIRLKEPLSPPSAATVSPLLVRKTKEEFPQDAGIRFLPDPPEHTGEFVLVMPLLWLPKGHGFPSGLPFRFQGSLTPSSLATVLASEYSCDAPQHWLQHPLVLAWASLLNQEGVSSALPAVTGQQLAPITDTLCDAEASDAFRAPLLHFGMKVQARTVQALGSVEVKEKWSIWASLVSKDVWASLRCPERFEDLEPLSHPLLPIFVPFDCAEDALEMGVPFLHPTVAQPSLRRLLPSSLSDYFRVARPVSFTMEALQVALDDAKFKAPFLTYEEERAARHPSAPPRTRLPDPSYDSPPAAKKSRGNSTGDFDSSHFGGSSGFPSTKSVSFGFSDQGAQASTPPSGRSQAVSSGNSPLLRQLMAQVQSLRSEVKEVNNPQRSSAPGWVPPSSTVSPPIPPRALTFNGASGVSSFASGPPSAFPAGSGPYSTPVPPSVTPPSAVSLLSSLQGPRGSSAGSATNDSISQLHKPPPTYLGDFKDMLENGSEASRTGAWLASFTMLYDVNTMGKRVDSEGQPVGTVVPGSTFLLMPPLDRTIMSQVCHAKADVATFVANRIIQDGATAHMSPAWLRPPSSAEHVSKSWVTYYKNPPEFVGVALNSSALQRGRTAAMEWSLLGLLSKNNRFPANGCTLDETRQCLAASLWLRHLCFPPELRQNLRLGDLNNNSSLRPVILEGLYFFWQFLGRDPHLSTWWSDPKNARYATIQVTILLSELFQLAYRVFETGGSSCERLYPVTPDGSPVLRASPFVAAPLDLPSPHLGHPPEHVLSSLDQWVTQVSNTFSIARGMQYAFLEPDSALFESSIPSGGTPSVPFGGVLSPPSGGPPTKSPRGDSGKSDLPRGGSKKPKASECLLDLVSPSFGPALDALVKAKRIPELQVGSQMQQLCFGFCVSSLRGCHSSRCSRLHVEPSQLSKPHASFLFQWLEDPAVKPHFRASTSLLASWPPSKR